MLRRLAVLLLAILAACGPRANTEQGAVTLVDPTRIERTGRPNDYLICPADTCTAAADAAPPVLKATADQVLDAWQAVVMAAPRTRIVGADRAAGLMMAEQHSLVFRFVDRISVKVLPRPDGTATYAAYSRSLVGHYDFGVNGRRLAGWAAEVDRRLGQ
jgi:uncharacterized protein (DUF1499 family)